MISLFSQEYQVPGYGLDRDSAKIDIILNASRKKPVGVFKERCDRISAWLPLPNILQIPNTDAIVYQGDKLISRRTGESIPVIPTYLGHFTQLYPLLCDTISVFDFIGSIGQVVDRFLSNIAMDYGKFAGFPFPRPIESWDGFKCTQIIGDGGVMQDGSTYGFFSGTKGYVADINSSNYNVDNILSMLAAYCGVVVKNGDVVRCKEFDILRI